jgi:hypothetical protein
MEQSKFKILSSDLVKMLDYLELGKEYIAEVLATHDANFGRERPRHKRGAESMEEKIKEIDFILAEYKDSYEYIKKCQLP